MYSFLEDRKAFFKIVKEQRRKITFEKWDKTVTDKVFRLFKKALETKRLPPYPFHNKEIRKAFLFYESYYIYLKYQEDSEYVPKGAEEDVIKQQRFKGIVDLAESLVLKDNTLSRTDIEATIKNSPLNANNHYFYDRKYKKHFSFPHSKVLYNLYLDTETYVQRNQQEDQKAGKVVVYACKIGNPNWPTCRTFVGLNVVDRALDFLFGINPHYDSSFPKIEENEKIGREHKYGKKDGLIKHFDRYKLRLIEEKKNGFPKINGFLKYYVNQIHKGIRQANLVFYNAGYDISVLSPTIREKYGNLVCLDINYKEAHKIIPGSRIYSRKPTHQILAATLPIVTSKLPPLLKDSDKDRDILCRLLENRPIYETIGKKIFQERLNKNNRGLTKVEDIPYYIIREMNFEVLQREIKQRLGKDLLPCEDLSKIDKDIKKTPASKAISFVKKRNKMYQSFITRYKGVDSVKTTNENTRNLFIEYLLNFNLKEVCAGRILEDNTVLDGYNKEQQLSIYESQHNIISEGGSDKLLKSKKIFEQHHITDNYHRCLYIYEHIKGVINKFLEDKKRNINEIEEDEDINIDEDENEDQEEPEDNTKDFTFLDLCLNLAGNNLLLNFSFNIVDLWHWIPNKSLDKSLSDAIDVTFKQERIGCENTNKYTTKYTLKDSDMARSLYAKMVECYGEIDNKQLVEKVKKGKISYVKYDMFEENGELYYGTSCDGDDTSNITHKEKFDYKKELDYLESDVKGLYIVQHYQDLTRQSIDDLVRKSPKFLARKEGVDLIIENPKDPRVLTMTDNYLYRLPWLLTNDKKNFTLDNIFDPCYKPCTNHSVPSAALGAITKYIEKNPQEIFRKPIQESYSTIHRESYVGGFTSAHKYITKVTPENFSEVIKQENDRQREYFKTKGIDIDELRPINSSILHNNKGRIVSIDVNSMYPGSLTQGSPGGHLYSEAEGKIYRKTSNKPFVAGHYIKFNDWMVYPDLDENGEPIMNTGKLYVWKPEYDIQNNDFFGNFYTSLITCGKKDPLNSVRVVPDFMLERFKKYCIADISIEETQYQEIYMDAAELFNLFYKIKQNLNGEYTEDQVVTAKLLMNSAYGKLGEKHREIRHICTNSSLLIDVKKTRLEELKGLKKHHKDLVYNQEISEIERKEIRSKPISGMSDLGVSDVFSLTLFDSVKILNDTITVSKPIDQITPEWAYISMNNLKDNKGHLSNLRSSQGICLLNPNTDQETLVPVRPCILAGLYVTSMCRCLEIDSIVDLTEKGHIFLYGDTDSIKLIEFGDIRDAVEIHGSKLGAGKIEHRYTHFVHNNKRKKYAFYDSCATIEDWSMYIKNRYKHEFSNRRGVASGGLKKDHLLGNGWDSTVHLYDAYKKSFEDIHTNIKEPTKEQINIFLHICKELDIHGGNIMEDVFSPNKTIVFTNAKRGRGLNNQEQVIIRNSNYKFNVIKQPNEEVLFFTNKPIFEFSIDKFTKDTYKTMSIKTMNTIKGNENTSDGETGGEADGDIENEDK